MVTRKELRTQEREWRDAPKNVAPKRKSRKRPPSPKRFWG
jgi:hypothetical protein